MPTKSMPQPHWKTAVRMPKAAIAVRKFVIAAWSGISSERNATSSTIMLSSRIVAITSGRRLGDLGGQIDVGGGGAPDERRHALLRVVRDHRLAQVRTRSAVAGADGAVLAITVKVVAWPLLEIEGGLTSVSPLPAMRAFCSFTSRGSVPRSSPPAFVSVVTS